MKIQSRFAFLLVSLFLILLVYPILGESQRGAQILALLLNLVPLSGAYIVSKNRRAFTVALLLAIPTGIATWYVIALKAGGFIGAVAGIGLLAYHGYVIVLIINYLVKEKNVTADTIFGAACLYLLLGMIWATLFTMMERLSPGSFSSSQALDWKNFLYFSFVTLTTLGYGDIYPISHGAKSLAITEALTGVLYIAILVGRIIGIYISQSLREK